MQRILIDSGMLLSYYQQQEPLHQAVVAFFVIQVTPQCWLLKTTCLLL
ncbi:hypothetical protein [Cyanobium sp. A2C-AMD]|nr:hypothetical protein [Cyanobium sp. A2C-AMD]